MSEIIKMKQSEVIKNYTEIEREYFSKIWNKVINEIKSKTTRPKKEIKNETN